MSVEMVVCICPKEAADQIAREVVQKGLAACVDTIPGMWGLYAWKHNPSVRGDVTLLITSHENLSDGLYETILKLHPCDLPVIVSLPLEEGYGAYVKWLKNQLGQSFDW